MAPLYNAYGAKILRSKFCKDKQNWSFETSLLEIWWTYNFNRTQGPVCGWAKLISLSPIPFNQNQNPKSGVWLG
jgi:hypothetical protein